MSGIPPVLVRTSGDESRGENTPDVIDPLNGYDAKYHEGLESIPLPEAGTMIYGHLNYHYYASSEFSSWSGLATLGPDTRGPQAAKALLREENLGLGWAKYRKTDSYVTEYCEGEYLIHGRLEREEAQWQAVKLDGLLEAGLFAPFFDLKCRANLLHQRAFQLRNKFFKTGVKNLPSEILAAIKKIAACFGEAWEGTVTVALIASRRRDLSDDKLSALLTALEPIKLPQFPGSSKSAYSSMHYGWKDIPEATQFYQMMRLLTDLQAQLEKDVVGDGDSAIEM